MSSSTSDAHLTAAYCASSAHIENKMVDALSTAQPFVCGGLSACFASSIVHPVDLAKVRLQLFAVQHAGMPRPSFPEIISTMVKKEGISSIYSGLSAALARQCVYGTARIGLHRTFSDHLQKRNEGKPLNFGYKALRFDSSQLQIYS